MTTDGTTIWIYNAIGPPHKIFAYTAATGERDTSKEFSQSQLPAFTFGIYSDGTTMWIADSPNDEFKAYTIATKARDTAKDFDHVIDGDTGSGLWADSDQNIMYSADSSVDPQIVAYNFSDKMQNLGETIAFDSRIIPGDMTSDGTTLWALDTSKLVLTAFNLSSGGREPASDINLRDFGLTGVRGVIIIDDTLYVNSHGSDALYAFTIPSKRDLPIVFENRGYRKLYWGTVEVKELFFGNAAIFRNLS